MLSPKDTVYPRLKKNISRKEINKLYTPTVDEIAIAQKRKRGRPKQSESYAHLYFLVMMKTFQRLGYFEMLSNIPYRIIKHIASKIGHPSFFGLHF